MATNNIRILELTIRALCDVRANAVADGLFLFSQTSDNQDSVLSAAQQAVKERLAEIILLVESDSKSGYPGYSVWEEELIRMGISRSAIAGIDLSDSATLNTLIEAEAMIRFAKRNHYGTVYVSAAPFHQPRAFMTAVTAALRYYPQIRIYSYTGSPVAWLDSVSHSQGKTCGPRKELIRGEIERIRKYQKKGDLSSEIDVLNYLNRRDTNNF